MHFIFYQNILSMHQSAFLRSLSMADGHDVTLTVAAEEEVGREKQGWRKPDFGQCEVIVAPAEQKLLALVEKRDAIHVFTGLCAFPMVEQAFKHSCGSPGLRRLVYSEPWRSDGWRGFLRRFRYRWLAWKYADKVEAFLLTGKYGVESFVSAGFPRAKCHEWGYYTEMPDMSPIATLPAVHDVPRLIFIGTWDVRKNIIGLIKALKAIKLPFECLLLGDGLLRSQVEAEVAEDRRFRLVGNVPNEQIGGWLSACDVLVLPSLFDGWGAVVNEALQCGTRALVSDKCGAASLVVSPQHGAVFALPDLKEALESQIRQGLQTFDVRTTIRQWAEETISGIAVAKRFVKICNG